MATGTRETGFPLTPLLTGVKSSRKQDRFPQPLLDSLHFPRWSLAKLGVVCGFLPPQSSIGDQFLYKTTIYLLPADGQSVLFRYVTVWSNDFEVAYITVRSVWNIQQFYKFKFRCITLSSFIHFISILSSSLLKIYGVSLERIRPIDFMITLKYVNP